MPEPSIFDYLAKLNVSELTVTQLNSATKLTNLDPVNQEFWQGVILLNRVLQDSRTFRGLPIPETGDVHIETIADSASATVGPDLKTEIWQVERVERDGCNLAFVDNDGHLCPLAASAEEPLTFPLYLSSTLKLAFSNGTGGEQTPSIAYFKVAL